MSTDGKFDAETIEMIVVLIRGYKRNGFNDQDIKFKLRKRFEDGEIQAAIEAFAKAEGFKEVDEAQALREPTDYFGWYPGPRQSDEYHWPRLKSALLNKDVPWTQDMIKSLDNASTTVVAHIAPPDSERPIRSKGLVLGYIQSGKTANFSATIAKAIDEGYKLIIVLAGMHNNLRRQTEVRLREELVWPASGKTCTTLTTDEATGDFKKRQSVTATRALGLKDGFTLAVIKKNSSVLRNFRAWIQEATPETLKRCPTLIIDDESDQASINTNKEDDDPTAINNHIRELIKLFDVVSYVGYTATPFANVFVNASVDDDLYPKDFLIALDRPQTYYGPEELFGRDAVNGKESTDGMPVIRKVPASDSTNFDEAIEDEVPLTVLPSLADAIDSFLVGGSLRLSRGQWKQHISMLVHVTHLTRPQQELKEAIEKHLKDLKDSYEDGDNNLRKRILKLYEQDFAKVTAQVIGPQSVDEGLLWKNLGKFIDRFEVIMDNSNSSERLSYDNSLRGGEPLWGIVIGGNTLSRGLTLEGLTTSYFVRDSKAYDTLLQMGRWFGYRKGYADLTRIFVTDGLYDNFYHLATIEQEIRDEVRVMSANHEKPIDVALRIRRHPYMTITAANKMRSAVTASLTYAGTKVQTHQVNVSDRAMVTKNLESVEFFARKLKEAGMKRVPVKFRDLANCHLFKGVSPEVVLQFLDAFQVSESNVKFHKSLVQSYISEMSGSGILKEWSVAFMSLKQGSQIQVGDMELYSYKKNARYESSLPDGNVEATLRVTNPGEELIDLEDKFTEDYRSTDDILEPKDGPKRPDLRFRLEVRPPDRGLLMIYPVESNLKMTDEEYRKSRQEIRPTYPLRGVGQLFAIALVFPRSPVQLGQMKYMKNKTV